jgi:hypothetical protein
MHLDPPLAFGLDPSAQNTPARKGNRTHTCIVDNRKLKIAVERRGEYGVPHNAIRTLNAATGVALCGDLDGGGALPMAFGEIKVW